jgi:2-methylcitrate dehydratase
MPTHLTVHLKGGKVVEKEKLDYEGFFTRPMGWDRAVEKFNSLSSRYANEILRKRIFDAVDHLEDLYVSDLTKLLQQIPDSSRGKKR